MRTITGKDIKLKTGSVATIGKFEGLHLGHQALMKKAVSKAKSLGLPSLVLTFTPHPAALLRGEPYCSIFSDAEKSALIENTGIDILVNCDFDKQFSEMSPKAFENMLFDSLNCKALVVGQNFTYGKGGLGNALSLKEAGTARCLEVEIVDSILAGSSRASSSLIRKAILEKDFSQAERLMGRPYFIWGKIAHGKELGRTIGFPTINIVPDPSKLLPENGVYITKTLYRGELYPGMTNVGTNPTFGGLSTTIETYLLGFGKCIYDEEISIHFIKWMREEKRFENVGALQRQLQSDYEALNDYFGNLIPLMKGV